MNDSTIHPLDMAVSLTHAEGVYHGKTSPLYANMIGPFGGISAATMLRAVLSEPRAEGDPIAVTFNFSAPIQEGDFTVNVTPVQLNRSTQHWMIALCQGETVCMNATAVLGKRRDTYCATESSMPSVPSCESVACISTAGLPAWVQNYRMRIVEGGFSTTVAQPDDYVGDSKTVLWIEDHPPRPVDFVSLTAICDIFFPRVFVKRQRLMPASTISLTIHFHAQSEELAEVGSEAMLGTAKASTFSRGYFDQIGELWSPTGKLLATTSQMVYFKD